MHNGIISRIEIISQNRKKKKITTEKDTDAIPVFNTTKVSCIRYIKLMLYFVAFWGILLYHYLCFHIGLVMVYIYKNYAIFCCCFGYIIVSLFIFSYWFVFVGIILESVAIYILGLLSLAKVSFYLILYHFISFYGML
eukprot:284399_1